MRMRCWGPDLPREACHSAYPSLPVVAEVCRMSWPSAALAPLGARLFVSFVIFSASNYGFSKGNSGDELAKDRAADRTCAGVGVAEIGVLPTLDNALADFSSSFFFCFSAFHFDFWDTGMKLSWPCATWAPPGVKLFTSFAISLELSFGLAKTTLAQCIRHHLCRSIGRLNGCSRPVNPQPSGRIVGKSYHDVPPTKKLKSHGTRLLICYQHKKAFQTVKSFTLNQEAHFLWHLPPHLLPT
jgi:hypothetical protein